MVYLHNGTSCAGVTNLGTVHVSAGFHPGYSSAGVSWSNGGGGGRGEGGGGGIASPGKGKSDPSAEAETLATMTVTAIRPLTWGIPRWAFMPNPFVVLAGGLVWPGNMAACQEPSCMPALHYNEEVTYPVNPESDIAKATNRFKPKRRTPAKIDKEDGSVWEKDTSQHGGEQWKRWPNTKSWETGETPQSVWPDGRIRK